MKKGFTLAEVLITLGVIGIVAALTMPTIIAKYKEKQIVTSVKVAYSIFSQAFIRVVQENGTLDNLVNDENSNGKNGEVLFLELSKYIKNVKSCGSGVNDKCFGSKYKTLDGRTLSSNTWNNYTNMAKGVLGNGMSFWILNYDNTQLGIDINGKKGPNQLGVDFFHFGVNPDGRLIINNKELKAQNYELCDINGTENFNGYHCSIWIIKHENLDYLKRSILGED